MTVVVQIFYSIHLQTILRAYISIYRTHKSMSEKSTTNISIAETQEERLKNAFGMAEIELFVSLFSWPNSFDIVFVLLFFERDILN